MKKTTIGSAVLLFFAFGLAGCGGSGGSIGAPPPPPPPPPVAVSVAPTTASVQAGSAALVQFTATVTNAANTGVTWSVNGVAGGNATFGTITAGGAYTAPATVPNPASFPVTATSVADTTKSASATVTITPPVTVTISPTSANVQVAMTAQFTATVANSSNTAVTWSVNGVAGGNATVGTVSANGLYAAPAAVPNPANVTVTAASQADASKSASATVTVTPVPVAPTLTGLALTATVAFGGNASFTFQTTGIPSPTVTCAVTGTGACSISGTTAAYTVPNPANAPASFTDTLTVTAQNSAGSASATVAINLVASITSATVHLSVDPQAAFCTRYNCSVNVDIVGTGFFAGTTTFLQDLVGADANGNVNSAVIVTDSSHATMVNVVGKADFRPKPWHFSFREPGPCCGFDSNVVNFVFLGNLDTMDISATDAFQLNQPTGVTQKFLLTTGGPDGSFSGELDANNIAIDNQTGYVIFAALSNLGFNVLDANGTIIAGGTNSQQSLATAAKGGYMCGSQDVAGQIVSLQLVSGNGTLVPLIVGNTPWQTAMLTLNGQLACVVYNVGDSVFTVAPIPIPPVNPAPLWTLPVAGLTPLNQVTSTANIAGNIMPNGGWPLIVSQSANKAAVLSRFDRKVAIIDLLAKKQTQTVDLAPSLGGAVILRMAVDDPHQKAVISLAQTATESSTFISVDLATGAVAKMNATTSFYATDLRVSVDGATLYCGDSAGQFLKVPNN